MLMQILTFVLVKVRAQYYWAPDALNLLDTGRRGLQGAIFRRPHRHLYPHTLNVKTNLQVLQFTEHAPLAKQDGCVGPSGTMYHGNAQLVKAVLKVERHARLFPYDEP